MEETKRRILCVEDDEDTCEMLTLALQLSGYEVVSAHTFADAITKALTTHFDAYILDSRLPDGSGVGQETGLNCREDLPVPDEKYD